MPELTPRFNIAPTQHIPVVRQADDGSRRLDLLHWGLIPSWAKDPAMGAHMINARAETVAEKPSFRRAFQRRRCLVPADGFYEWQIRRGAKQPYFIHRADGEPFAIAGLWERWQPPWGEPVESCALVTTQAVEPVRSVHPRMPVILPASAYGPWLDPRLDTATELRALLAEGNVREMEAVAVSTRVNDPRNDRPECIEPLTTNARSPR